MGEVDLYLLLMKLRTGGSIVRGDDCTHTDLVLARADHRLFTDKDGFTYVYKPREKKT